MRLISFREPGGGTGVGWIEADEVVVAEAHDMLTWLGGGGRGEAGEKFALDAIEMLAPVSDPPSFRDFYAFEGHVAAGWQRRGGEVPAAWYEAPSFYFSNPASIHGPDQPVARPAATTMLDFELEVAAVIGIDDEIAGFTLLNDWSARDVQRSEMTVGLGPAKGKDFASSLGPWLATPDELAFCDGRLDVEAWVSVNGHELSRTNARDQHFSWDQLVAHAARDTRLRPGDLLGSGTMNRGCLLELGPLDGPDGERWLEPGDTVEIGAEGLGTLTTQIV